MITNQIYLTLHMGAEAQEALALAKFLFLSPSEPRNSFRITP
jgi:hypothetical protein